MQLIDPYLQFDQTTLKKYGENETRVLRKIILLW